MRTKLISLTLALLLGAGVAACGEDEESTAGSGSETTEEAATSPAPAGEPAGSGVDALIKGVSKTPGAKPKVPAPAGDPPPGLVKQDIVEGKGRKAKAGDEVTMQYVGISWSNGQQFDASWDRGQPFPFTLGAGMVIPGWDQGIVGMKKGGRRVLVIPPDMGYGPQGSGPIGPNETLVFVVDLVDIKR